MMVAAEAIAEGPRPWRPARKRAPLFDAPIVRRAVVDSFRKLDPRRPGPQPGDVRGLRRQHPHDRPLAPGARWARARRPPGSSSGVSRLAVVHRAVRQLRRGDGRGARQGAGRRAAQGPPRRAGQEARRAASAARGYELVAGSALRKGDVVLVEAGDVDPGRRRGRSRASPRSTRARSPARARPVIRESGGDRSAVTGGTRVLSDWLIVRITANPGETFLDRMIAHGRGRQAAEDAERDRARHPAGGADDHLPAGHAPRCCRSRSTASRRPGQGTPVTVTVLVALLVCLIPTTIGGLLSAIGIAGMDRMIQANVIAMSGRAVEAAGDVDVLLLDKTGTITLGNRQATAFLPAPGVDRAASWPTPRSSPRWPTRRPRAAASSCWPRRSSSCASRDVADARRARSCRSPRRRA